MCECRGKSYLILCLGLVMDAGTVHILLSLCILTWLGMKKHQQSTMTTASKTTMFALTHKALGVCSNDVQRQ